MRKLLKIKIFCIGIFILAIGVWYSPVMFKGYAPHDISNNVIILARNLAETGQYAAENDLNILLSSDLINENTPNSTQSNKLTPFIYGKIFKFTGQINEENIILLASAVHALTLVILALLILHLFGFKISLFFSLIYIFLPFNWLAPYSLGSYEFSLLFFSIFFLLYFWGINKKYKFIYLIAAGVFLALACLAKEIFLLFLPFFFIYLWRKKQKSTLLYIFITMLILLACFWLPDVLAESNMYLLIFTTNSSENLQSSNYGFFGHLFPDPYTYHFEKEAFLENFQKGMEGENFISRTNSVKTLATVGIKQPGIPERIASGIILFLGHLFRFFSLEEIGGPFVSLLIILGIYDLKKRNVNLSTIALGWIFSLIFILSFIAMAGRSHLLDFGWVIALLIALGIGFIGEKTKKTLLVSCIILLALIYNLVLVDHVVWGKLYDARQSSLILAYGQKIREAGIPSSDVIAVPGQMELYRLNYSTDRSLVLFRPATLEKLIDKGELPQAFEKFNVKYILGYSDELSEKVTSQAEATNIASNSLEVPEIRTSGAKMWLMNLVR